MEDQLYLITVERGTYMLIIASSYQDAKSKFQKGLSEEDNNLIINRKTFEIKLMTTDNLIEIVKVMGGEVLLTDDTSF